MQIKRDQDVISNSSSVLENEKIKRQVEENKNKDKIELEFELTAAQKLQD